MLIQERKENKPIYFKAHVPKSCVINQLAIMNFFENADRGIHSNFSFQNICKLILLACNLHQ